MSCEDLARDPLRRARVQPPRAAGFTLVELVTVLMVLAILAAIAAPRFMQREAFEERGFLDATLSILRYAQRVAIAERREVCVALTASTVALSLNPSTTPGAACTAVVGAPGESAAYAIAVPAGLTLALTFPNASFRFNGLGQPVDNAGAALGDQTITLTGSTARTITVWGQTGYVQ
jgi:MSHA pilin protein MshC